MKKITSLLAIAAVALTAVFSFASCSKNDDPAVEPEEKLIPVDSLIGVLEYEYSEAFLKLYDIKFEVTDFNGKSETFTVTEPGHAERIYKTTNVSATGKVKVTNTPKDAKNAFTTDSVYLKSAMRIINAAYVRGKLIYSIPTPHPENALDIVADVASTLDYQDKSPYSFDFNFSVVDSYKNGVTESWLKQYGH